MRRKPTAPDRRQGRSADARPVARPMTRHGRPGKPLAPMTAAALASGVLLWEAMRLCESWAAPALGAGPAWLALVTNAGIEEALRLGLGIAIALAARAAGLGPGAAMLAVAASSAMAACENVAYVVAFPTADAYWRLGYAAPIHMGAAAAYGLALSPAGPGTRPGRRAARAALGFASCWLYHAAFNTAASLFPFTALPLVGTLVNAIALSALAAMSARTFLTGELHGRVRV